MSENQICAQELAGIISKEIPEIKSEVNLLHSKENIAGLIQIVVNFTREMLKTKHWAKANWNLMLMGWIYSRADLLSKELIENILVRSFNGMKSICGQLEWPLFEKKIPLNLYGVYLKQNSKNQ